MKQTLMYISFELLVWYRTAGAGFTIFIYTPTSTTPLKFGPCLLSPKSNVL